MNGFKKCPNGHYYQDNLQQCPYCPTGMGTGAGTTTIPENEQGNTTKTQVFGVGNEDPTEIGAQQTLSDPVNMSSTISVGEKTDVMPGSGKANTTPTRTIYGDEDVSPDDSGEVIVNNYRSTRKLVGWLVSYTLDDMGVDYKVYEGKNIIGRDVECNITVNDKMVSSKHATLLFRSGKFRIKDELSSHGTFVNNVDIEDEHVELHDGDIIKMGETIFKFKCAL